MVTIPNNKIVFKGRLGPGQVIAVNLDKGKVYDSKSIKNHISKDYKQYNKQIMDLDKKLPDIVKKYPDAIIKKIGFNEDNRLYEQCIHASNLIKDINLVKLINQDVNTKVTIDLHAFSPLCFTYFDINFEIDPIHAK